MFSMCKPPIIHIVSLHFLSLINIVSTCFHQLKHIAFWVFSTPFLPSISIVSLHILSPINIVSTCFHHLKHIVLLVFFYFFSTYNTLYRESIETGNTVKFVKCTGHLEMCYSRVVLLSEHNKDAKLHSK